MQIGEKKYLSNVRLGLKDLNCLNARLLSSNYLIKSHYYTFD